MSRRHAAAMVIGACAALLPSLAAAQEGASRALDAPAGALGTVLATIGAIVALFVVASLGYLYLRTRSLAWGFQQKELPPEPGSDGHH